MRGSLKLAGNQVFHVSDLSSYLMLIGLDLSDKLRA